MGCRWDELGELTKQFRRQISAAAAGSKQLAAVHAGLKSRKAKANSLDESLKLSRKEIVAVKEVFEEQMSLLDAAGATMTDL